MILLLVLIRGLVSKDRVIGRLQPLRKVVEVEGRGLVGHVSRLLRLEGLAEMSPGLTDR